ncbi:MAG: O-antigen ligase family protein [Patescibacteria group bacterium]
MAKIKKVIEYLFLLFLFFLPWQTVWIWREGMLNGGKWQYGTYGLYGSEIILWLILILQLIVWAGARKYSIDLKSINRKKLLAVLAIWIFFLWASLSIFWSADKPLAFYWWFKLAEGIILFFLILNFKFNIKKINWALVSAGAVQAVLAIGQFLSQAVAANKWLGLAGHRPGDVGAVVIEASGFWLRPYGSFPHPNILGGFLLLGFFLALIIYFKYYLAKPKMKLLLIALILIISAGIFFSFSRSAWLGAGVGYLIFLFAYILRWWQNYFCCNLSFLAATSSGWRKKILTVAAATAHIFLLALLVSLKKSKISQQNSFATISLYLKPEPGSAKKLYLKELWQITASIIILIGCLSVIYWPLLFTRFSARENLERISLARRADLRKGAEQIIKDKWLLGAGLGNYTWYLYKQNPNLKTNEYQPVHNIFLLVWAELGLIGFFIFLFFYFYAIIFSVKNKNLAGLVLWPALGLIGLFDHYLWTQYVGIMIWWIGLAFVFRQVDFES